jgi:hypothetical protein
VTTELDLAENYERSGDGACASVLREELADTGRSNP